MGHMRSSCQKSLSFHLRTVLALHLDAPKLRFRLEGKPLQQFPMPLSGRVLANLNGTLADLLSKEFDYSFANLI
jgi:hypothetical protein